MRRFIAVLMSLLWLLNAVAASAFMSAVERDDGGFLIPICSGGQIILVDLSAGAPSEDSQEQDQGAAIDCPLLTAVAPLPELLGNALDVEHTPSNDGLEPRSQRIPGDRAADRPGARGPPTLS
ncbi:hypothetical protein [Denitrobaculum tricleocarpae]|uniref:DUF2946 domain-containing protein n=1 Tax=Denitrobaculum tricleocarpae TaxID=2591009 RepID=A0A545TKW0_9PROT|nr:hypothetical protein [Denitrobaculum tricleocarpae]TQV77859.1 hypothetical protein FKG95_20120 [Denitrobaculum tricleocarpae]